MASTNLAIHIPPDANPTNVSSLIRALAKERGVNFKTVQELIEFGEAHGLGSRTEIQYTATKLGLIERTSDGIKLSKDGEIFASLQEGILGDILHYLMYSRWSISEPLDFISSWSFKLCCDLYWNYANFQLTDKFLDQRVEEIINEAENTFKRLGVDVTNGVSFSRKSLNGFHKWLAVINPPVLDDRSFTRRLFCPPELLLLAIGYVVQSDAISIDTDILLSREKRDAICRVCLLDPDALDRALDWMIPIFPKVIGPGTLAGFYGRFIRLHKIPTLEDVVR